MTKRRRYIYTYTLGEEPSLDAYGSTSRSSLLRVAGMAALRGEDVTVWRRDARPGPGEWEKFKTYEGKSSCKKK